MSIVNIVVGRPARQRTGANFCVPGSCPPITYEISINDLGEFTLESDEDEVEISGDRTFVLLGDSATFSAQIKTESTDADVDAQLTFQVASDTLKNQEAVEAGANLDFIQDSLYLGEEIKGAAYVMIHYINKIDGKIGSVKQSIGYL